jgi:hypothetical protein
MSTLTLEVLAPFTVRQHGHVTTWQPGQRMILSQEKARRVLACVGNKVRMVESNRVDGDLLGQIVTWESPLFGLLRATVLQDLLDGVRVFHPLTEMECVIPMTWLRPHVDTVIPSQP